VTSRSKIAPFLAMEAARNASLRAAAGRPLVRLDVGQPHWCAPVQAIEAGVRAMRSEPLGYTDALGRSSLRERIARYYSEAFNANVSPERIAITTGASGAFLLAFLALFDTGDAVALASPGYPPYRHILHALGMRPMVLEGDPRVGYQLTPTLLEAQPDLAGALAASPANPTGAMLDGEGLAALCSWSRATGKPLIVDEIYQGLVYGASAGTVLAHDGNAIVINSFSKYWAMTGWRVGWLVVPEHLVKAVERLAQNLTVAPPTPAQVIAEAALDAEDVCAERRAYYGVNRALLLQELPGLSLPLAAAPDGAFYALVDISAWSEDSFALADRLLDEVDLAATPGVDFCERNGSRWLRLAYCRPKSEVEEALVRLARFRR
jgi:aspartate/methionine/tyrosine aminotransferase